MYSLKFLHPDDGYTMHHCNCFTVRKAKDVASYAVTFPAEPDSGLRDMTVLVSPDNGRDYVGLYIMENGNTIEKVFPNYAALKDG